MTSVRVELFNPDGGLEGKKTTRVYPASFLEVRVSHHKMDMKFGPARAGLWSSIMPPCDTYTLGLRSLIVEFARWRSEPKVDFPLGLISWAILKVR